MKFIRGIYAWNANIVNRIIEFRVCVCAYLFISIFNVVSIYAVWVCASECIQRMHPATAKEANKKMNKNSYLIYIILALCVCDARWYQFTRRFLYLQNEWTKHTHTHTNTKYMLRATPSMPIHSFSCSMVTSTYIHWLNCTRINHQIKYDIFLRRSPLAARFSPHLSRSHSLALCIFANRKHKQDNVSQVEFQFS